MYASSLDIKWLVVALPFQNDESATGGKKRTMLFVGD
jgi:hypothetical protein